MLQQRKKANSDCYNIGTLKRTLKYIKDRLVDLSNEAEYEKISSYFEKAELKLREQIKEMPLGHKFTGTFYLKKPYSIEPVSIKVIGSAFIKEDLVSWQIETDDESIHSQGYHRAVYKDKAMTVKLEREDGEAVFLSLH
tara:strand:+ start:2432 stop:2848 length:417 start_codon:yes stop_codon:yes gene_type:complete